MPVVADTVLANVPARRANYLCAAVFDLDREFTRLVSANSP
jgi:hypothetical protein